MDYRLVLVEKRSEKGEDGCWRRIVRINHPLPFSVIPVIEELTGQECRGSNIGARVMKITSKSNIGIETCCDRCTEGLFRKIASALGKVSAEELVIRVQSA